MPDLSPAELFHLEQAKAVRAEIDENIKQLRQLEVYAVIGSVAVWGFLVVQRGIGRPIALGWWLPVVLCSLAWLKHKGTRGAIEGLAAYVLRLERDTSFSLANLGWEHSDERKVVGSTFAKFNWLFWGALFTLDLGFALGMYF